MELGEAAGAAAAAFEAGRIADVPEELVMAVTVAGGRQEAVARFAEYRRAGADLVLCYPVTASLDPFSSMLGTVLAAAPETAVER
jgi:2-methylisocitrate lyase-like PEP mutase family enzyme